MTRLIDADAITYGSQLEYQHDGKWENTLMVYKTDIDAQPTVDAEPVRYGKWKDHKDYPGLAYLCSECGCFTTMRTYRYCPYCGAVMRGYENGGHI